MILKNLAGGYRVRWREQGILRQQTVDSYEEARKLDARKVLKTRGGQRRRPVGPRNILVADFAKEWLEQQQLDVRPKTLTSFRETAHRYILPAIGALQVRRCGIRGHRDDASAGGSKVEKGGLEQEHPAYHPRYRVSLIQGSGQA